MFNLYLSSVCLVRNFPDIRLRILKLQIHNTIALMDNSSHSIAVRAEAAYALGQFDYPQHGRDIGT